MTFLGDIEFRHVSAKRSFVPLWFFFFFFFFLLEQEQSVQATASRVTYGPPVTTRAEEGLRVDSDTLRYLEKNEPLCPWQKCGPNQERPKSKMTTGGYLGNTKICYHKKISLK